MNNTAIQGIIVPILTPMHEDESVNFEGLCAQVERMIAGGVHGIFCFGTNGEAYILTAEEKKSILKTVIRQVNGRVPVYAGTGCISTKETVLLSKAACDMGADVLSIITPSFAAASQDELFAHYRTVAEAVPDTPIVLYNIPARTGNTLQPVTVGKLAAIRNICGVKDSSGNFANILNYMRSARAVNPDFAVLSGNDQLILWTLQAGGAGGIAGCANVYPKNMADIYNHFVAGRWAEALACQNAVASFRDCFRYGNPNTVVKTAAAMLGEDVGKCRAPFCQLSAEGIAALRNVLDDNAARGMC